MLVIADYGVGNLLSIKNMLKRAGFDPVMASKESDIERATHIILPGIGSFDYCMNQFNGSRIRQIIAEKVLQEKVPILGICVGLQMLMESSEEGVEKGLGWITGKTVKFRKELLGELKIPHMGWTEVKIDKQSNLIRDLPVNPRFYFVHSYYVLPEKKEDILLSARYGYDFTASVSRNNIFGVQFHPEKSHKYGMKILGNFACI